MMSRHSLPKISFLEEKAQISLRIINQFQSDRGYYSIYLFQQYIIIRIIQQTIMNVPDKLEQKNNKESSSVPHELIGYLHDLQISQCEFNHQFLEKVKCIIQSKDILQTRQISEVIITLLVTFEKTQNKQAENKQRTHLKLESFCKTIVHFQTDYKLMKETVQSNKESIRALWKKLIHYSCYKNYLDILTLFYFVGDILEYPQQQLKRILYMLLYSLNKIRLIQENQLLHEFLFLIFKNLKKKAYHEEVYTILNITHLCFSTKIKEMSQEHIVILQKSLKQLQDNDYENILRLQEIVWDKIFFNILNFYYHEEQFKEISRNLLERMIEEKLDMQTVKLMIKQLEITRLERPQQKWKNIFSLMNFALKYYNTPKNVIFFQKAQSYLKIPLNYNKNFSINIEFKNRLRSIIEQKILFKIEDKNSHTDLMITRINEMNGKVKVILLKTINKNMCGMFHKTVDWNENEDTSFLIQFRSQCIKLIINNDQTNAIVTQKRFIDNPSVLICGDQEQLLGTALKEITSIQVIQNNKPQNTLCLNIMIKEQTSSAVKRINLPAFIQIIKIIGDLDIFLLVISHAFKKLKDNPCIVQMIKYAVNLLRSFTLVKNVKRLNLNSSERQRRLNAIFCLCWQCSHETRNADAVLQLMEVLTIRDINNPEDELQILCNFIFWKSLQTGYQNIIIMKIKQLFIQMKNQEDYLKKIHRYCKKILIDASLYYREQDSLSSVQNRQNLLKLHYEFFSLIKQQMFIQAKENKQMDLYYDFIECLIKMLSETLKKFSSFLQAFDLTFSIELTILARQLGQRLTDWQEKYQNRVLKIVQSIFEVCSIYEMEEKYYEDKKIVLYHHGRMLECEDKIIKQNLYFLAYKILSLRPKILGSLVNLERKGIPEIMCIAWQKQFFEKIANKQHNIKEFKGDLNIKLYQVYEKLNFESLSNEQNRKLLRIYLLQKDLFPKIDHKLTKHLTKKITIEELLQILKNILKDSDFQEKSITTTSIIRSQGEAQKSRIKNIQAASLEMKIINILSFNQELKGAEALGVINNISMLQTSSKEQVDKILLVENHFILKYILQHINQANISKIHSQKSTFISSQNSQSQICTTESQGELSNNRIVQCFQYYLDHITIKDFKYFKGKHSQEELQCHLENLNIQIKKFISEIKDNQNFKISMLKYFSDFISSQLLPISKYFLQNHKLINLEEKQNQKHRRKSQHLIKFPQFDFSKQAKRFFQDFLNERQLILANVQEVWSNLQEKNRYFWATFISKQIEYTLYEGTSSIFQKYLIKKGNKKPKLQLPKMNKNSSIFKTISVMSQKYELNQSQSASSIFEDARSYKKEAASCFPQNFKKQYNPQEKKKHFKVMLVTSSKIYQGTLTIQGNKFVFKENLQINKDIYNKIYAYTCEMRTEEQCTRQNYRVEQIFTSQTVIVAKRYLFHDIAAEIHLKNRCFLFTFVKKDHRQAFLYLFEKEKHIKVLYRQKMDEQAKILNEKWKHGLISNYEYIMNFNNITGRSFNDLSQYYIFPWTVTNFQDEINEKFMSNPKNFRDLTQPIGKISQPKWQGIKKNFERMMRDNIEGLKPFLFGSFYSNPGIVSNYLIRISPFASQHYELQSKQFDLADRLFYSIQDNYKSLITCSSDCKQLIPQFYYFPQFLKNRNKYNLGARQNNDIVHNVALPKWASDEYEFIFRMKKMLQSEIVTATLHNWIDLVFGVYSKKQNALKANNLYLADLYIENYKTYLQSKDKSALMYFKQFGQVPDPVINYNTEPSKYEDNFYDSIIKKNVKVDKFLLYKAEEQGKILQIKVFKRFTIILFEKQIRLYSQQKFAEKDYITFSGDFSNCSFKPWEMIDEEDKKHYCIIVHNKVKKQLLGFQVKKNLFGKYSIQGGQIMCLECKVHNFQLFENFLVCSQGKNIYVYKNIRQQVEQEYSSKNFSLTVTIFKYKYLLVKMSYFTQHKANVLFMSCTQNSMLVSIDQQQRVFILEVSQNGPSLFNFFDIKTTYFEEKIVELLLHKLGYIILRTNYNRILIYTFLGDLIISEHIKFQSKSNRKQQELVVSFRLMNQDMLELICTTNKGNLYKLDVFALKKIKPIKPTQLWIECLNIGNNQTNNQFDCIHVQRTGRHFNILTQQSSSILVSIKSHKWNEIQSVKRLSKKHSLL